MSLFLGALCACQLAVAPAETDTILTAAELVARARTARYQQDSTLSDYLTIVRQRWSFGFGVAAGDGLGPLGRVRLAARFESVARIGWHHRLGAWGELLASRAVAPIVGEVAPEVATGEIMFVLPYHPGRDQLWPMTEMREALPGAKDGWIAHPLDASSDSLYRFSLGGPLVITLPDARTIRLRELLVRPVRPDSRLIVGSLWLDESNGALVRAAYRPSIAVDLWPYLEPKVADDGTGLIRRLGPFRGNVEEIVIEHGLYAGQFWLPRARIAHAEGTAKGGRLTISIEQTFAYERVRALAVGMAQARQPEPALGDDGSDARHRDWRDRNGPSHPCRESGDSSAPAISRDSLPYITIGMRTRTLAGVRLPVLLYCNRSDLVTSPLLPGSIYSPSEEFFTEQDFGRLRAEASTALGISSQAEWSPQAATLHYGLDRGLVRFNRIEGLSAGVRMERELGKGYSLDALARFGVADLEPNAELVIRRSSGHGDLRAGVFRRLDVANDWANPLGLSSSLNALLLGHDDGLYYRARGVELGGTYHRISGGPALSWRLFTEQHHAASVGTTFSLARIARGSDFSPNITATEGTFVGGATTMTFALGANPIGTQISGSISGEAAVGPLDYARASTNLRLARGLAGGVLGAVTGAVGTSLGTLPPQRRWYLGGVHSIHAHAPGAATGDAFWMARAELTKGTPLIRPMIFADVGWAGDRAELMASSGRYRAVGVGAAALDGLVRLDLSHALSRALDAPRRWSLDLFVEVR